jgi:HKD family nuclease
MVKIITERLNEEILEIIRKSCEVKILTAFLKQSGLDFFKNISHKNVEIITGIDFFITDPKAVYFLKTNGYDIKIFHQPKKTFHPKCFYFKTNNKEYLIIGSSNVTAGGMEKNYEISLLIDKTVETEKTFLEFHRFFIEISTSKFCFDVKSDLYEKYQNKYNNYLNNLNNSFDDELEKYLYANDKPISEISEINQDNWINHDNFGIGYVVEKTDTILDVFFFDRGRMKIKLTNLVTKIINFESSYMDKYFTINNKIKFDAEIVNYNKNKSEWLDNRYSFYNKWKNYLLRDMKPDEIYTFFDEAGKIWTLMTLKKNILSDAANEFNAFLNIIRDTNKSIYNRFEIICNKASSGKLFHQISYGITSTILSIIYPNECIVYNNASDKFMEYFDVQLKGLKGEKRVDRYYRWSLFCKLLKEKYNLIDLLDVDCFIGFIKVNYLRNI